MTIWLIASLVAGIVTYIATFKLRRLWRFTAAFVVIVGVLGYSLTTIGIVGETQPSKPIPATTK